MRLINFFIRSKDALRKYIIDDRIDKITAIDRKIINILRDGVFWTKIEDLKLILEFVYEKQIILESGKAHLNYVLKK